MNETEMLIFFKHFIFQKKLFIFSDGFDGSDCYGMPGRSPNGQFNYPAFTFPGNGGVFSTGQVI